MTSFFHPARPDRPRFRQACAADLCVPVVAVGADATNSEVLELFTERRELMTLPVVEEERPIGLISRNIFMSQMSKPFYQELYGRKSCIAFMDKEPLVVGPTTWTDDLHIATTRPMSIIGVKDGKFAAEGRFSVEKFPQF